MSHKLQLDIKSYFSSTWLNCKTNTYKTMNNLQLSLGQLNSYINFSKKKNSAFHLNIYFIIYAFEEVTVSRIKN